LSKEDAQMQNKPGI